MTDGEYRLGIVVIGRNEGERLTRCLECIRDEPYPLVYVDSGSTDGSPETARSHGAHVTLLEPPFSAGRARNAGFAALVERHPQLQYVQFLEGDCDLNPGWLAAGLRELQENDRLAAVSGILQEKYPEASIYNHLCALEWKWLAQAQHTCGGNSMMRVETFRELQGFDERLIAGEEPEFCLRLSRANWSIKHLEIEMAKHDAAITRFSQWWMRSLRNGYSYAACADLHGDGPERYRIRETRSNWFWGLALPLLIVATAVYSWKLALIPFAGYPVLFTKILLHNRRKGFGKADSLMLACFCAMEKFPAAAGQICFYRDKLGKKRASVIDYKSSAATKLRN